MAMILDKKEDMDNELSRRISADLRAKATTSTAADSTQDPDFVHDSDYAKDLTKTSRFGFIWIIAIFVAIIAAIAFAIK